MIILARTLQDLSDPIASRRVCAYCASISYVIDDVT